VVRDVPLVAPAWFPTENPIGLRPGAPKGDARFAKALQSGTFVHWNTTCTPSTDITGGDIAMEVRVRQGKDKQSLAFARFHQLVCDQPFDEGGSDSGMTPPELMLSALGCCAMYYAAEYLKARGLSTDSVELRVTGEKGGSPVRLQEIAVHVDAAGLPPRFRTGLLKAVEACLVGRTLAEPPQVSFTMANLVADGVTRAQVHPR